MVLIGSSPGDTRSRSQAGLWTGRGVRPAQVSPGAGPGALKRCWARWRVRPWPWKVLIPGGCCPRDRIWLGSSISHQVDSKGPSEGSATTRGIDKDAQSSFQSLVTPCFSGPQPSRIVLLDCFSPWPGSPPPILPCPGTASPPPAGGGLKVRAMEEPVQTHG